MLHSAVLNVMIKAAHRAGRSLKRDLGEIEHLQVSVKGPRNFVTAADHRAEAIVRQELAKARPDYGFLGKKAARIMAPTRAIAGSSIRSTARPISSMAFRTLPSRLRSSAMAR
jgi:fructose-1,6-bisphosphatase/inositol monophosphatase family enzyme